MVDLVPYSSAVLVVVGSILLLGFRRRILLRIGVRNFLRRKSQVALVVAGLFIATSIISGALVMGDSLDFTVHDLVFRTSGLVDEVVWLRNDTGTRTHESFIVQPKGFFDESVYTDLRNRLGELPHVDGVAPEITIAASVLDTTTDFVAPGSRLLAFDPARDFDTFLVNGGAYDGADLPPGHVLLNEDLAGHLGARPGDALSVSTALRAPMTLYVHEIVDDERRGGFFGAPNLFMRLSEAQGLLNVTGRINAIFVSNVGGVEDGHLASDVAVDELRTALPPGYTVDAIKKNGLDELSEQIQWITQVFGAVGLFTIVAGVLLIMNIFVVLAEERKSEMGMSRALGMRRVHLTETYVFEGFLYAVAASAIGAIAGLAVAALVIYSFASLFGSSGFSPKYHFEVSSLVIAFVLGFLITMAVVTAASWRVSRLNIVRAIRNIPEPIARKGTRRQWTFGGVLVALGLLVTWQAVATQTSLPAMVGPALLAFGLAGITQRFVGARPAYTAAALTVGAWALVPYRFGLYPTEEFPIATFVFSGIILVFCAIVAIMFNSGALLAGLTRLAGRRKRLRPVVKTAFSYPMARKGRTGLTLAMFALVVFIITMVGMFASLFFGNVEQVTRDQTGGYDVGARAFLQPPGGTFDTDLRNAAVSAKVAEYSAFNGSLASLNRSGEPFPYPVFGIPSGFATQNRFPFARLAPEYATPLDAWDALAADRNLTIFDGAASGGFEVLNLYPGDGVEITNLRGEVRTFTVIGVMKEFLMNGMFVGDDVATSFFSARAPTAFLFKTASGSSPVDVERELERDLVAWGMDATALREAIEQIMQINVSFIRIMQSFLALGLIVGVAGLGVVTMRNVVERRNEIGTLRAIGFRRSMVLTYLLIENSFVSLLGIGVGIALGVAYAYDVFLQFFKGSGSLFDVPWLDLFAIAIIAYAAGLVSTFPPSRKAARLPPAEALRIVE